MEIFVESLIFVRKQPFSEMAYPKQSSVVSTDVKQL